MRTRGAVELAEGVRAMELFGFAAVLVNFFQPLGHVFHLAEEGGGDVERPLLRRRERDAIARARIDLDNFAAQFILLLENEPGEIGGVLQLGDDGALDGDIEAVEHVRNQIVSEGPLFGGVAQEHADDGAHVVLDLNDEDLLLVSDEDGTTAVGGEYPPDLNRHDIILHKDSVCPKTEKTSPMWRGRTRTLVDWILFSDSGCGRAPVRHHRPQIDRGKILSIKQKTRAAITESVIGAAGPGPVSSHRRTNSASAGVTAMLHLGDIVPQALPKI